MRQRKHKREKEVPPEGFVLGQRIQEKGWNKPSPRYTEHLRSLTNAYEVFLLTVYRVSVKQKSPPWYLEGTSLLILRKVRDSNPRTLADQQFSRLPPSTTRPTFL